MPPKKLTVKVDGQQIDFKQGALRKQLKVPEAHKFTKSELSKLKKIPIGESFDFLGNQFKMTRLLKRRITLAMILMK